jgi:hypothetical protein
VASDWSRFAFSARPWFYFLPDTLHPVFGGYVRRIYDWIATKPPYFITKPFYPREHTLFLGWTTLILSAIAIFKAWRQRRQQRQWHQWIWLFLFLGIVMMIFSAPPYITVNLHKIYFPSYFLAKIFPMFRSYARVGVLVLLCFSILAAFGFRFLLERIGNKKLLPVAYFLVVALVFFEFLNFPPFRVVDIGPTAAHRWIAQQPGDFAIAEWPVVDNLPLIRQRYHRKHLIDPLRWAPHKVTETLKAVDTVESARELQSWGVRYLLVHTRTPEQFVVSPWYRLVAAFPKDVFYVFEVVPNASPN